MKGERIGVDASTMEANAALRNIKRSTGEGYRGMLALRRAVSRHPSARTWRVWTASTRARKLAAGLLFPGVDAEAKIAGMRHHHLATSPSSGSGQANAGERGADPGTDEGADDQDRRRQPSQTSRRSGPADGEDPAECVTDRATTHGWS